MTLPDLPETPPDIAVEGALDMTGQVRIIKVSADSLVAITDSIQKLIRLLGENRFLHIRPWQADNSYLYSIPVSAQSVSSMNMHPQGEGVAVELITKANDVCGEDHNILAQIAKRLFVDVSNPDQPFVILDYPES